MSLLGQRAQGGLVVRYLLSIVTALVGTAIFFAAFFPGSRGPSADIHDPPEMHPAPGSAARSAAAHTGGKERVVIMLVDALRADFIWRNESRFAFVNAKIAEGVALPFTTRAHSPTVTLPRIKAMITGSIPGFLDIKANLDSPALKEDNVVARAVSAGRRVLMYGDETWLKLFPSSFVRSDGTTSFFVLDTKMVDDNVTRHVKPELDNNDWDVMILHYLGLDHAGHLGGTDSEIMLRKQLEMDDIVKQIYTKFGELEDGNSSQRQTILVLCSDHGMNTEGGHGGASEPETDAVAIFFAPPALQPRALASDTIETSDDGSTAVGGTPAVTPSVAALPYAAAKRGEAFPVVWQVDMAPTLALLLALEVPAGNIGRLMPGALDHLELMQYLDALSANARQLQALVIQHT